MLRSTTNHGWRVSHATLSDVPSIVSCTNDAYVVDAFFKKPEYHNRFTEKDVEELINTPQSIFVVVKDDAAAGAICGSLYLQWSAETVSSELTKTVGKFSAVAVHPLYQKRGIGQLLVKSAESHIIKLATEDVSKSNKSDLLEGVETEKVVASISNARAELTMGVINVREELFPWYQSQGFTIEGQMPWDAELSRIMADGYEHVSLIQMRKTLL